MHAQAEAVLYDLLKAGVAERKACSINDILEPTCSENRVNFQYITRISIRCKSAFWTPVRSPDAGPARVREA